MALSKAPKRIALSTAAIQIPWVAVVAYNYDAWLSGEIFLAFATVCWGATWRYFLDKDAERLHDRGIILAPITTMSEQRAEALLREHLTDEQWEDYTANIAFNVRVQRNHLLPKTYRITAHGSDNIYLLTRQGQIKKTYCCSVEKRLPRADRMLALKLWMENSPREFFEVAVAR